MENRIKQLEDALIYALHTLNELGKLKSFKSRWPEINSAAEVCDNVLKEKENL